MTSKTIGIVTQTKKVYGHRKWDPDVAYYGISGAEEALLYMSQELAALGHRVIVFADPPPHSIHSLSSANPRYLDEAEAKNAKIDIAIAFCQASLAPELKKIARRVFLWPHGYLYNMSSAELDALDGILWLSKYQRDWCTERIPALAKFKTVFGNGIHTSRFPPIFEKENPYSCIYASNYARGLDIMLMCWPHIKDTYPKATLDIYYGYGGDQGVPKDLERWLRSEIPKLYDLDVREHGRVGHDELNFAYSRASFWTFPSLHAETFCISALRAQFAGTVPIVYQWGGLCETVQHGFCCSDIKEYPSLLMSSLNKSEKISLEQRKGMRDFILEKYTWKKIASRWIEFFSHV